MPSFRSILVTAAIVVVVLFIVFRFPMARNVVVGGAPAPAPRR